MNHAGHAFVLQLPTEIIEEVCCWLDLASLARFGQASSYIHELCNRDDMWHRMCAFEELSSLHETPTDKSSHETWKHYYKTHCTRIYLLTNIPIYFHAAVLSSANPVYTFSDLRFSLLQKAIPNSDPMVLEITRKGRSIAASFPHSNRWFYFYVNAPAMKSGTHYCEVHLSSTFPRLTDSSPIAVFHRRPSDS